MLSTSMTTGKISACSRPAPTATAVRSAFARANRAASCGSRTKARTTRMPAICSRSTRLTSSIIACMRRNRGTMRTTTALIAAMSTGTHTATSQDSAASSRSAITMPPTHMIGAATSMVHVVSTSICTCWTSFVHLVISDGAPKRPTSRVENSPTRWNTAARTSAPRPFAVREPWCTAAIEHATCTTLTSSISAPRRMIRSVSPVAMPPSMISAFRLGR
jgi:hypothetical protein